MVIHTPVSTLAVAIILGAPVDSVTGTDVVISVHTKVISMLKTFTLYKVCSFVEPLRKVSNHKTKDRRPPISVNNRSV